VEYLAENTAPVWALSAVLLTMASIAYVYTRSASALLAVAGVILLTGVGLLAERLVVTPREAVQQSVRELLAVIEADDLPGVLAKIAPSEGAMRSDAELLMPQFDINKARATGEIEVAIDRDQTPPTAAATFRFFADVLHRKSGMKGGYFDNVTIFFKEQAERWVVTGYSTDKDWRKDAGRL
jgi:hypothetical protein